MLTPVTKKKIDNARDILVGKIPMPTTQVEQITLAMIYKFMADMDKRAKALGDTSGFFANGYEQYAWDHLMDKSLSARDRVKLYSDGLEKMSTNPHIPQLFRDIFRNAYLPFNDPETLKLFLDQINQFSYDNSEELGNAFEYLLSVMSSQGDAGQFRTPRHIIDFIVEVVEPTINDRILDPACGTAGFLISAFKYLQKKGLPAEELKKVTDHVVGYDISHDMVRLSLVNLYLHQFPNPHIYEYDTLTSEDRWNDQFDCILANPPFMTPKGGIRPHSRFSIPSNRAEVLFVDYIMEHLSINGKAGIIVPEGIIFQSQNAYKNLRKMMVEENYLWAVVSLPAGIFQPYSGVKTSVLLFDKDIARKTDNILFLKAETDGFDLDTQRRKSSEAEELIDINWMTQELVSTFKPAILDEGTIKNTKWWKAFGESNNGKKDGKVIEISKKEIRKTGDYNLSGERYQIPTFQQNTNFQIVSLSNSEYFQIESGGTPSTQNEEYWRGDINWATLVDLPQENYISEVAGTARTISDSGLKNSSAKLLPPNSVLVSTRATIGRIGINKNAMATNQGFKNIIVKDQNKVLPKFVAYVLTAKVDDMRRMASGGTFAELSKTNFSKLEIPMPPLSVQTETVEELDHYQKIIDGARQVVENYQPTFKVDSKWKWFELGSICDLITDGTHQTPTYTESGVIFLSSKNVTSQIIDWDKVKYISEDFHENLCKRVRPQLGDVLLAKSGTTGVASLVDREIPFSIYESLALFRPGKQLLPDYLLLFLNSKVATKEYELRIKGVGIKHLHLNELRSIKIPLPGIEEQNDIISAVKNEQQLIKHNHKLISLFNLKIKSQIDEFWSRQ